MEDPDVLLPPTLRARTLTVEGAEKMRELLDDENQPGHEGQEMPTADASILLQKVP